jgi:predicted RNA-binding protein YlxR (DUF448 family)
MMIQRRCIATRQIYPIQQLFRLAKWQSGEIFLDLNYNLKGRGCYVLKNKAMIDLANKKNLLARALKTKVNPCFYEQLYNQLEVEDGSK